jgi:hypothetical protein
MWNTHDVQFASYDNAFPSASRSWAEDDSDDSSNESDQTTSLSSEVFCEPEHIEFIIEMMKRHFKDHPMLSGKVCRYYEECCIDLDANVIHRTPNKYILTALKKCIMHARTANFIMFGRTCSSTGTIHRLGPYGRDQPSLWRYRNSGRQCCVSRISRC